MHLYKDWHKLRVPGSQQDTPTQKLRDMSKFSRSSKNCGKFLKSQFLLKLLNSSGNRCRKVPSKNCDFCNFTKNCEKFLKWQFLLKLLNSSGKGGRKVPSKNCNFSKTCEIFELVIFLVRLPCMK